METTTTLYENGDAFEITYKRAETKEQNKTYISINDVLNEVISKVKINSITATDKISLDIFQIDELTKQSLLLTPSLIRKLMRFSDDYSKKLVAVFNSFIEHKDFEKMHKDYAKTKSNDNILFRNRWDFNTRCNLLEVIYPA